MELAVNNFFILEEKEEQIYITVFEPGYQLKDFNTLLEEFPRMEITQFLDLKDALINVNGEKKKIGVLRPYIGINISKDKMKATIRINETDVKFEEDVVAIIALVYEVLEKHNVTVGILDDVIKKELSPRKDIVVAEGISPVKGENAIIRYFELSERKPTIHEDGQADYYDMNFIDEVEKGDWLGEKIHPTDGVPGKTITNEEVPPKRGKDERLLFDRKTVSQVEEDNKFTLRAATDGVIKFIGGKICVDKHLRIDGDVGVETGNIKFDGSVEVRGTIHPNYQIKATSDIAVMSELGIYGAECIESEKGDVFIKGGIFGENNTLVKAGGNIYVKHTNACKLEATEDIYIGIYSIGSVLHAKNVLADPRKGRIIGGYIEAKGKVVGSYLGNKMEKLTLIRVEGFNRKEVEEELQELIEKHDKLQKESELLKRQIEDLEKTLNDKAEKDQKTYEVLEKKFVSVLTTLDDRKKSIKSLERLLEVKGEGQIIATKQAFPEVVIELKKQKKKLKSSVTGTFYVLGETIQFE